MMTQATSRRDSGDRHGGARPDTELSPADLDRALDSVKAARLGLVPAPRPADVLGLGPVLDALAGLIPHPRQAAAA